MDEDVKELIMARLDNLPPNIKISIGGRESLTKAELMKNVQDESFIGEKIAQIHMNYIKSLIRR